MVNTQNGKENYSFNSETLCFDNVGHLIVPSPTGKDGKLGRRNCEKCTIDERKDIYMCEKFNVGHPCQLFQGKDI